MYSGLFNSSNPPLLPGLFFTCYDVYMGGTDASGALDNVSFFSTAPPIATSKIVSGKSIYGATSQIPDINVGTNGCITTDVTPEEFSIQWLGYFKPNVTSTTWYFRTTSDDCSYLWIGPNATTGFTRGNANVNNGGLHGSTTVPSNAIPLNAGIYYPLRIQFGGKDGGNVISVEFSVDNTNWFSNGTDRYFHT